MQGVADGDVAGGIMGVNPIQNGQLTREEIQKAEADPDYRMELLDPKVRVTAAKRKGPRYTPISRRNERPNAIKWLLRNHPELKDAQIMRLVGTTKSTIDAVREGTHWNTTNLAASDPVTLGLCSQIDLDLEVKRAAAKAGGPIGDEADEGTMLMSAEEALATANGKHRLDPAAHADRRPAPCRAGRADGRGFGVRQAEVAEGRSQPGRRRVVLPQTIAKRPGQVPGLFVCAQHCSTTSVALTFHDLGRE